MGQFFSKSEFSESTTTNPGTQRQIIFPEHHLARLYVLQLSYASIGSYTRTPQIHDQLRQEWNGLRDRIERAVSAALLCPRCKRPHSVCDQEAVAAIRQEMRDANPADPKSVNLERMRDWVARLSAMKDDAFSRGHCKGLLNANIRVEMGLSYLQALQHEEKTAQNVERMREEWDRLVTETIVFFNEEVIGCCVCGRVHDEVLLSDERTLMGELADLQREMRCADPATVDRTLVSAWVERFARFGESFGREFERLREDGGGRCLNAK